jgi:predicted RNA binding protein YcfA (HicA-like mRNA interferase family)
MPPIEPVSRRQLIASLRARGFDGPYSGGRHELMRRGDMTLFIPNADQGDIGRNLLARMLQQAGIDRSEWDQA